MGIKDIEVKKKAQELVSLMKWEGEGTEDECFFDFSKECALVAVDEIISVLSSIKGLDDEYYNIVTFYRDVKAEIESMTFA